jgi:predicted permease
MNNLWQDVRFGARMLAKNPGFTAIAVLTLALGIGANTGIFSVLRQVVLQSLPVPQPEQLVLLYSPGPKQGHVHSDEASAPGEDAGAESFSYPIYTSLRDHNDVFTGLAAVDTFAATLAFRGRTERTQANLVSGNYFQTLGVGAALGRTFEPADTAAPGSNPVVMLSDGYWKRRFGADPSILNQSVLINNHPMTIVGIVSAGFDGIQPGFVPEVYIPIWMLPTLSPAPKDLTEHKDYWVKLIGRLKPGISLERAATGLGPLYSALLRDELPLFTGWNEAEKGEFLAKKIILRKGARGRPILSHDTGPQLTALMGMVGLVLFIACANVAGLLTARGAARQQEIALRLSLGASRGWLVRQLVVESLLLSVSGAVLGLAIAAWTSSALVHFAAQNDIANGLSSALSPSVLAFACGLALVSGILFGVAPSVRATRVELVSTLKEQGPALSAGLAHARLRQGLVAGQVALTLLLVTAAGGFARSLSNVKHIDLGLRSTHLLQFRIAPRLNGYDQARSFAFFRELEDQISALPGVLSLSGAQQPLIADSDRGSDVTVEDEPTALAGTRHVMRNAIGPGHFSNLGIPLVKGREFTRADVDGSPKVAIINETMAKTFFPMGDAVGRRMKFGGGPEPLDMEIVAIVKDSHHSGVIEDPKPFVYVPYAQEKNVGELAYYVRTSQDPRALAASVRGVAGELDSTLPLDEVRSFEEQINQQLASNWLIATLAEIFGALAAVLAAIGIYGLLAFAVTQRTREIGVRMALGADAGTVGRIILRDASWLVGIGVLTGLPLAYGLSRLINSMLYRVKAFEFPTVGSALVVMVFVALAAAYLPARRATRVDPLVALRYE